MKRNKVVVAAAATILSLMLLFSLSIIGLGVDTYTVFLASGTGYETTAYSGYNPNNLTKGANFWFVLTVNDGYSQSVPEVKANDTVITPEGGIYKLTNISEDIQIKVSGIKKNTYTATLPSGDGYEVKAMIGYNASTIDYDGTFKFFVELKNGYTDSTPIVLLGETPLTPNNEGTYSITAIRENITTLSVINVQKNMYTISFYNEGVFLGSTQAPYGEIPVFSTVPEKEATAQFSYVFSGWTPEVLPADTDTSYNASFTPVLNKYTVTFVNYDDTVLLEDEFEYGSTAVYPYLDPERARDDSGAYAFSGWNKDLTVLGDMTVKAVYKHSHTFELFVKNPTCSEKGYTIYTCSGCGYHNTTDYTPTTEHIFGEWMEITPATEYTRGVKSHECIVCGEVELAEIPVISDEEDEKAKEEESDFNFFTFLFGRFVEWIRSLFLN